MASGTLAAPTVAAIIPTRDRPALVVGAVRSALGQTYPAIQVWVIDDGSDPPLELPEDLADDARIHVVRLAKPHGSGAARNRAVTECGAGFLAFLDDDDAWSPTKVEVQMEALRRAPADVAGVESGWVMRDGGRTVMRYLPDPARDLRRRLLFQPCMAPSTVLLRRSAFEALGGFRADLLRLQDWELWIRLADRYRMLTIPKIHAVRRPSELSASAAVFYVRRMVEILRPRIDRLPPRKRRAVLSRHLFAEGVELARAGQPREARSRLWRAWCSSPTHVRPLAHVGRTFLGERSWTAFAGGTRRVAQGVASLVGADLYLYRW